MIFFAKKTNRVRRLKLIQTFHLNNLARKEMGVAFVLIRAHSSTKTTSDVSLKQSCTKRNGSGIRAHFIKTLSRKNDCDKQRASLDKCLS